MSFGQPPTKTPYGDQDFIKEEWAPQNKTSFDAPTTPQPQPVYGNRDPGTVQNVPYSSLMPPQPSSTTLQQGPYGGPPRPPGQPDVANLVKSLTPEDQIFMQSWRRDSFYYRVLPLTAIGSGALYFFNQQKNLPHKTSRYFLISIGAYVIGKWSYKGELRRRLEATPSNTPFIKALRDLVGVPSRGMELGTEFSGDVNQDHTGFGASNDLAQTGGYGRLESSPNLSYEQPNYAANESDLSSPNAGDGRGKSMTSYEELRARNRGMIQK